MFYFIAMLVTPSFKDYLDYFYDFDFPFDPLNEIFLSTCVFSAGLIYAVFLKEFEVRSLVIIALECYIVNNFFNVLLVRGITFGLSKWGFL